MPIPNASSLDTLALSTALSHALLASSGIFLVAKYFTGLFFVVLAWAGLVAWRESWRWQEFGVAALGLAVIWTLSLSATGAIEQHNARQTAALVTRIVSRGTPLVRWQCNQCDYPIYIADTTSAPPVAEKMLTVFGQTVTPPATPGAAVALTVAQAAAADSVIRAITHNEMALSPPPKTGARPLH